VDRRPNRAALEPPARVRLTAARFTSTLAARVSRTRASAAAAPVQ